MSAHERLALIDPNSDECHEWSGNRYPNGYGFIRVSGRSVSAHRLAYEHFNGPIPAGMFVCHRCDNPPCCNPRHLFLGTPRDNALDMHRKGRARNGDRGKCTGSKQHLAKLVEADIPEIRRLYASGVSQQKIADIYGVSQVAISYAVIRKTWKHVK